MKRPRAPIACFRCHRKKVRCDGAHPFCTRCQSTGSTCSYPSSRRSRNTQPHHVDPYIDHLSQLEHQIRQIEVDMNEYRNMLLSSLINNSMDPTLGNTPTATAAAAPNGNTGQPHPQEDMLRSHLSKTEQEVQESRTILAQLRLRGEQRIARTKRNQTKEAKQQQQRQQQQQHRASSVSPNNDKKKSTTATASSSSRTKVRKNNFATIPTSSNEGVASSSSPVSYLGDSHDSSSATKSANNKPGMKSYLPSTSSSSSNTLQHVSTSFLPINTSMDLYGQSSLPPASPSPSTSYQQLYHQQQQQQPPHTHHHHQHTSSGGYPMPPPPPQQQQQQQHQPTDFYYMTMVGGGGTSAEPAASNGTTTTASDAYYDPLMDYPWTTPTDFAATTDLHVSAANNQDLKPLTTTASIHTPTATNSSMETEIKSEQDQHQESAHYSPSTVAAIEEVTRMAQQMNHPHQQ